MESIDETQILATDSYEKQSELNDMKQHADKIIQGIKKLEEKDAFRAIWELFQNAVDLSQKCEIEIKQTEDYFEFKHNGEIFTPLTLDCLFKQVSSKTLEERKVVIEDGEPVGQYGTGFITSHSFGKNISINSGLKKGKGYIKIEDFRINRDTSNWKELGKRIQLLKEQVSEIIKTGSVEFDTPPKTSITYITSEERYRTRVEIAIKSLPVIVPYVMALNTSLKKVTVTHLDGTINEYINDSLKTENGIIINGIKINGKPKQVFSLNDNKNKFTIILPLKSENESFEFDKELPKLFLFYPLVGTQSFGVNFIIHSRYFQPTEPRDGIYLDSDNTDNKEEERANRLIIEDVSKLIFKFIQNNASRISNPINFSQVNFNINTDDEILNEYFKKLKSNWLNELKNIALVENNESGELAAPTTIVFFDSELLEEPKCFDSVYNLAVRYWKNIPKKNLIPDWTKKVDEWNLEGINYIGFQAIAEKLNESNLSDFETSNDLIIFYQLAVNNGYSNLFEEYKLLPNLIGEFEFKAQLYDTISIPLQLREIVSKIYPKLLEKSIHDDFKLSFDFKNLTREELTNQVDTEIKHKLDNTPEIFYNSNDRVKELINYCKILTVKDSGSIPSKMMDYIAEFYNVTDESYFLEPMISDKFDIRPSQKKLLRYFLNEMSKSTKDWVEENIIFLEKVISIGKYDDYKDLFQTLKVFPNQYFELCNQSTLKIDVNIPQDIKDLYDEVVKRDIKIKGALSISNFTNHLFNPEKVTARDLAEKIETEFFDNNEIDNINDHPFKDEILSLIEKTKHSEEYAKYFRSVYSQRSAILLQLADDEDSFSILSLESSKRKKLGKLARDPNFDKIIELGEEAYKKEQQENSNFKHKYTIGTHIEDILRKGLTSIISGSINAVAHDVQNGQDIIIEVDDTPVYYIEVKSRWNSDSSIRMSKNQTLTSHKEKLHYALCSVDMSKYTGTKRYEVENIDEIKSLIKFNTNIGEKVSHLISFLTETNEPDSIHLDGEYRTLIPQSFIDTGKTLNEFETFLINFLRNRNGK